MLLQQHLPFTVLKRELHVRRNYELYLVATALTVYGIETHHVFDDLCLIIQLQQHLPFTVLKLTTSKSGVVPTNLLQQHLPFTVLKLEVSRSMPNPQLVATALTVYGIETKYLFLQ